MITSKEIIILKLEQNDDQFSTKTHFNKIKTVRNTTDKPSNSKQTSNKDNYMNVVI